MESTLTVFFGIFVLYSSLYPSGAQEENNECYAMSCDDCAIKGPNCAWCASPDFTGGEWERCKNITKFKQDKTCHKKQLMSTDPKPSLQTNKIEENLVSISKAVVTMRQGQLVTFPVTVLVPRNNKRKKENVMIIGWRSGRKPVELTINSDCKNRKTKGHKFACKKVKRGKQVTFALSTHLKECPNKGRKGKYKIVVKIGRAKKIIQMDAYYVCQCKVLESKKKCAFNSRRKTLEGNCVVQATVTGDIPLEKPEREENDCSLTGKQSLEMCNNPKSMSTRPCSDQGQCVCGYCECNNLYTGKFCECSRHTCIRFNGMLCGGKGECECGMCKCSEGYTGDGCECPTSNATCLSQDGSVCNNNGECICGKCECRGNYRGRTCSSCPTCVQSCKHFKRCAECLATVGSGMPRTMCREACDDETPEYTFVDEIDGSDSTKELCSFPRRNGCPLLFEILREPRSNSYELIVERKIGYGKCDFQPGFDMDTPELEVDECSLTDGQSLQLCQNPNNTQNDVCSGNGRCVCGTCECHNIYHGKYCECSKHTCPRYKGMLCGGRRRGECECGECRCAEGYTGVNCGCPTTNNTCLSSNGSLCNNNGYCICGECKCQNGYRGLTCDTCPTCVQSCDQFKQCAECLATVGSAMPRSMCRAVCDGKTPEFSIEDKLQGEKQCYFVGQDGCPLNFEIIHQPNSHAYVLLIEKRTDCFRTSQKCRSDDHCIAEDGSICNRKGSCSCGFCQCPKGYTGDTCDQCTECSEVCSKYEMCATCLAFESPLISKAQCEQECSAIRPGLKKVETMFGDIGKKCQFRDSSNGCIINFAVKFGEGDKPQISVLDQRVGCGIGIEPIGRMDRRNMDETSKFYFN